MGILGEYTDEELAVLRPEPPSGEGGDGGDDDDDPKNDTETLTDEEIDDIIENAKENGFDGIDEEDTIDEDDEDLTPEPDEDEDEEEGEETEGGDEEETEGGDEEGGETEGGETEEGDPTDDGDDDEDLTPEPTKEGEDDEEGGDEKTPTFEDITEESEEDEQRRLRVRYAQLMKRMQNSQKSLSDLANKHGKKIPERILNSMEGSAKQIQDLKEINVYED